MLLTHSLKGYYHHIANTHFTFGFVEMKSEISAKRAIQGLIDGRYLVSDPLYT